MIETTPILAHKDADVIAAAHTGDPAMPLLVLCAWRNHGLVCWLVDARGECFWGAYGPEAWSSFKSRLSRYCIRADDIVATETAP